MKTSIFFLIYLVTLFGQYCSAQTNSFTEIIEKLKENYPGYIELRDKVKFEKFVSHVKKSHKDSFEITARIFDYFKDPHLSIYKYPPRRTTLITAYEGNFEQEISKKRNNFWIDDEQGCIIMLVKESKHKIVGYIYKSRSRAYLRKGSVCFIFKKEKGQWFGKYTNPYMSYTCFKTGKFVNDSTIIIPGEVKLRKIVSNDTLLSNFEFDEDAKFTVIDSNNVLLTLPSFSRSQIAVVDSIIKRNDFLIRKAKHLIIDLRNNLGGYVNVYKPLFPYVYTNPIKTQSVFVYPNKSTISNYEEKLNIANQKGDTIRQQRIEGTLIKLKTYLGKNYFSQGDIIKYDKILPNPKEISIIINFKCLSAAELMLLDFKQSTKVKIYGEPTGGAVDYLDEEEFQSKDGYIYFTIASSVRDKGFSGMSYDNIGIRPDVILTIPEKDWLNYIIDSFNKINK